MKYIILTYIAIAVFLCGCSCNYHLDAARKKCGKTTFIDTLTIHDTTVITRVSRDTTFYYNQSDTVLIREGRLTIKYFYHDSIVYLAGECAADTVVKVIRVPVTTTTLEFSIADWLRKWWWIILVCAIIGYSGYRFFKGK